MRSLLLFLLAGCATAPTAVDQAPPPPRSPMPLDVDGVLIPGRNLYASADGLGLGERVYLFASTAGTGRGPCSAAAGATCLGIRSPVLIGVATADYGYVVWDITIPPSIPLNTRVVFQAAVVRGMGGADTWTSSVEYAVVQACYGGANQPDTDGDLVCDDVDTCPTDPSDLCHMVSCVLDVDDAWGLYGESSTWDAYDTRSLDFSGFDVTGGLANGDAGGFGVDGTHGPAFLVGLDGSMYFDNVRDVSFDVFAAQPTAVNMEAFAVSDQGDVSIQRTLTPGVPVSVTFPGRVSDLWISGTGPIGVDHIVYSAIGGVCTIPL